MGTGYTGGLLGGLEVTGSLRQRLCTGSSGARRGAAFLVPLGGRRAGAGRALGGHRAGTGRAPGGHREGAGRARGDTGVPPPDRRSIEAARPLRAARRSAGRACGRCRCRVGGGGGRGSHDQRVLPGRAAGVRAAAGLHVRLPEEGAPAALLAAVREEGALGGLPQGRRDRDPPARGRVCVLPPHGLLRPGGEVTLGDPPETWHRSQRPLGTLLGPGTNPGDPWGLF